MNSTGTYLHLADEEDSKIYLIPMQNRNDISNWNTSFKCAVSPGTLQPPCEVWQSRAGWWRWAGEGLPGRSDSTRRTGNARVRGWCWSTVHSSGLRSVGEKLYTHSAEIHTSDYPTAQNTRGWDFWLRMFSAQSLYQVDVVGVRANMLPICTSSRQGATLVFICSYASGHLMSLSSIFTFLLAAFGEIC